MRDDGVIDFARYVAGMAMGFFAVVSAVAFPIAAAYRWAQAAGCAP